MGECTFVAMVTGPESDAQWAANRRKGGSAGSELLGITKKIREPAYAPCGKSGMDIVQFTDVRRDLCSGAVPVQGSNNIAECAFTNGDDMHIYQKK